MEIKFQSFEELVSKVLKILPNATFEDDNDGQVIIYTDLAIVGQDQIPTLSAGKEVLVSFDDYMTFKEEN